MDGLEEEAVEGDGQGRKEPSRQKTVEPSRETPCPPEARSLFRLAQMRWETTAPYSSPKVLARVVLVGLQKQCARLESPLQNLCPSGFTMVASSVTSP